MHIQNNSLYSYCFLLTKRLNPGGQTGGFAQLPQVVWEEGKCNTNYHVSNTYISPLSINYRTETIHYGI